MEATKGNGPENFSVEGLKSIVGLRRLLLLQVVDPMGWMSAGFVPKPETEYLEGLHRGERQRRFCPGMRGCRFGR